MDVESAKKILDNFSKISLLPKRKETFMSISGYPHYENVVSNILKFFFEDNEHGMKNLWITALLECVPELGNVNFKDIVVEEVIREYVTENNKRIDLVVICDDYIISIENKIYHYLANDLQEYAATISALNQQDYDGIKKEVNVVLSLNSVEVINNFYNVTYDMLFEKIKLNIGMFMLNADNGWLIKMQDFIYTIEGLKGGSFMDKKLAEFIHTNYNAIENLYDAIYNYRQNIRNEVKGLKDALYIDKGYNEQRCKTFSKYEVKLDFYYSNEPKSRLYSCAVVDIKDGNKTLAIETYPDGMYWHVVLWVRKGNKSVLREILKANNIEIIENIDATQWWNGCEVACVEINYNMYEDIVDAIVSKALPIAKIVIESKEL